MTPDEKQEKLANLRYGPYLTPVVAFGVVVECEVRGLVTVVGLSDAPIPWPIGQRDGIQQPIVFKALARAIRQESTAAVAKAWGITVADVESWRLLCRQPRRRKKQTHSSPPIPWKSIDDDLIGRHSLEEAARLTGRTLTAVRKRRRVLGLPDGRRASQRSERTDSHQQDQHLEKIRCEVRLRTARLNSSLAELRATICKAKATGAFWRSPQRSLLLHHLAEALADQNRPFDGPADAPTDASDACDPNDTANPNGPNSSMTDR